MEVIYPCSLSAWLISMFTFLRLKCHFLRGDFPVYHHAKGRTDHSSKCLQGTVRYTWFSHEHVCVLSHFSHVQLFVTPWTVTHQVPLSVGVSPGKNTGVGCHALLQGIFLNRGSNPGLPHCRWILYWLSYQGSPRILERVAYPFSRGSSRFRNRIRVSCIAGGVFTSWATREAPILSWYLTIQSLHT